MVRDSMDILGLLRKKGIDGDVDFLREALAVLGGIMEAEVGGSRLRRAQSGAVDPAQRIPQQELGYAGGHDGATSLVCLSRGGAARRRCWR